MIRDHDDLIGGDEVEQVSLRTAEVHTILGGVSLPWLMKAFGMGRQTAERRLRGCHPIGQGKHGTPLYDLAEAASYLVTPRMQIEEYLKGLKPEQLPERLRESFWSSKLKQQRWEEKARHLWRSEDVLNAFSDILTILRTSLQLIPDRIELEHGLSDEQREVVTQIVDDVQAEMHSKLKAYAEGRSTPSQISESVDEPDEDDLI